MRTLQTMLAGLLLLIGWGLTILGVALGDRESTDEYPPCRTVGEAWRAAVHDVEHWLVYVNWKKP